jgi:hypothetical protein
MAKPKLSTPSVNYGPKPGATPTPPIKQTPIEKVPVPRGKKMAFNKGGYARFYMAGRARPRPRRISPPDFLPPFLSGRETEDRA